MKTAQMVTLAVVAGLVMVGITVGIAMAVMAARGEPVKAEAPAVVVTAPVAVEDVAVAVEPEPAPEPAPPPELTLREQVMQHATLSSVLRFATPMMDDEYNKDSRGTVGVAIWSALNMRWKDIDLPKDETSFQLVRKDVDSERGKAMCIKGRVVSAERGFVVSTLGVFGIVQIEVIHADDMDVSIELAATSRMDIYRTFAIGSTGRLVQNSSMRFCGIVTGKYDYSNSNGGTGHAVTLVGMYDLPANRQR